jgi:hypothetical protein
MRDRYRVRETEILIYTEKGERRERVSPIEKLCVCERKRRFSKRNDLIALYEIDRVNV